MKRPLSLVFALPLLILLGCQEENAADSESQRIVGDDKDEHGCIATAGYQWDPETESCVRPWEQE